VRGLVVVSAQLHGLAAFALVFSLLSLTVAVGNVVAVFYIARRGR
jgi:hypothetical protein